MDDPVVVARVVQTVMLASIGVLSGYFLLRYRRIVNIRDPFARYTVVLNSAWLLIAVGTVVGRLFPGQVAIESTKALLLMVGVGVATYQLMLLRIAESFMGEPEDVLKASWSEPEDQIRHR